MADLKNKDNQNLFLNGFDVVSYYNGGALKGSSAFSQEHDVATFHFASKENLEKFHAGPSSYTPEYGGFCAAAISEGKWVPVDPENHKAKDGRLFLLFKQDDMDTLPQWNSEESEHMEKADEHWKNGTLMPMSYKIY